ncbi:MAG TPA: septum formation initiator family protein [Bacteroidetes bacterium]|nr:septum formation initiator family protein [Bacteroidota bacterium]
MSLRERFFSPRNRRRAVLTVLVGLGLWVAFLDSHSLLRRALYARDLARIESQNEELRRENDRLRAQINAGLDDETVEQVAREQYGMRRPGETVYRVVTSE